MSGSDTHIPFWQSFPNLAPGAISDGEAKKLPWHSHAASPRSSQVFCVSAFGPLISHRSRDTVYDELVKNAFTDWKQTGTDWKTHLEFSDRSLLNEISGTPTQVDVLLKSSETVVAVESKFVVDAKAGLGHCSRFRKQKCSGFHGSGSDPYCDNTWCQLERWDGRRSPRLYWAVGHTFFQSSVFVEQNKNQECPFKGSNYQIMRAFE